MKSKTREIIIDLNKRLPKTRHDIYNIVSDKHKKELCRLIIIGDVSKKYCPMVIDSFLFKKPKIMNFNNLTKITLDLQKRLENK